MTAISITLTRLRRLSKPQALPQVDAAAAHEWFAGWWHGIAIGLVCGGVIGALMGGLA